MMNTLFNQLGVLHLQGDNSMKCKQRQGADSECCQLHNAGAAESTAAICAPALSQHPAQVPVHISRVMRWAAWPQASLTHSALCGGHQSIITSNCRTNFEQRVSNVCPCSHVQPWHRVCKGAEPSLGSQSLIEMWAKGFRWFSLDSPSKPHHGVGPLSYFLASAAVSEIGKNAFFTQLPTAAHQTVLSIRPNPRM